MFLASHYRNIYIAPTVNGLVEVNPAGRHPIYDLITRAELAWQAKQRRASKTLKAAVAEYQRRYDRDPPLGFDNWWEYVREHNVQLPDEYDQIYRDLERYWGMNPTDLRVLLDELEMKRKDAITILAHTSNGDFGVVKSSDGGAHYGPVWAVEELLEDVKQHLPSFRAVFTFDDRPNRLKDFTVEDALLKAAGQRTELHKGDLPPIVESGWRAACDPTSPVNAIKYDLDGPPPPKPPKTLIHDHRLVMDPCLHPDLLWNHGQFLSHDYGPWPQPAMIPEFAWCSTTIHHDIRVPSLYGWDQMGGLADDVPWEGKSDERLVWRGSLTGSMYSDQHRWRTAHRTTPLTKTNAIAGNVHILNLTAREEPVGQPLTMRNAYVSPSMFDIGIAGPPTSCIGWVCDHLEHHFSKNRYSDKETWNFKYILDLDGNGWSGRFNRIMRSNSLIFKSTIYPEWYVDRVQPWVHYLPLQVDMSDLHDILAFFRGGLDGKGGHDDLAKKIASEGKRWSQNYWRREDMTAYLFRLFLEYGRVMSPDRDAMAFKL